MPKSKEDEQKEIDVKEVVGRYIDPTDERSIKFDDSGPTKVRVIINSTQVSATHIVIITEELKHAGYEVVVVDSHPAEAV